MTAQKVLSVCGAIFVVALGFGLGAGRARGQSTTFRVIGAGIVVVGDAVYELKVGSAPFGWVKLPDGSFDLPLYRARPWSITAPAFWR